MQERSRSGLWDEVAGAQDGGARGEGCGPMFVGGEVIGAHGLDVEGEGEALLRGGEIEQGGANDALGGGKGEIERGKAAFEALQQMLVLMEGGEEGAVAAEQVQIGEGRVGGLFGIEQESQAERVALLGGA